MEQIMATVRAMVGTRDTIKKEDAIHLPFPKCANGLTPAENERLDVFVEELAEVGQEIFKVIQAASKIRRHGFIATDENTHKQYNNREDLETELGHLRNAIKMLADNGDIDLDKVEQAADAKRSMIGRYLHHQN